MKKILLIAICVFLSVSSFSQSENGNDIFDNAVYARIALGFPGGELSDNDVVTAGPQFEVGTIFYLNSLKIADKMKLGIDVTYVSVSGVVNSPDLINDDKSDSYFMAGAKAGPCFSYNFAGDFIADAYFKLYPNMLIAGETQYHDYNAENQFKLGTSFGLNVRYKALMVGFEFTSTKYDFEVGTLSPSSESIKLPVTFVSLGVNF